MASNKVKKFIYPVLEANKAQGGELVWVDGVRRMCCQCGRYKYKGVLNPKRIVFVCEDCQKDASDLIPIPSEVLIEERTDPATGKQEVRYVSAEGVDLGPAAVFPVSAKPSSNA